MNIKTFNRSSKVGKLSINLAQSLILLIPTALFIFCVYLTKNPKKARSNINPNHILEFNLTDNRLQVSAFAVSFVIFFILLLVEDRFGANTTTKITTTRFKFFLTSLFLLTFFTSKSVLYSLIALIIFVCANYLKKMPILDFFKSTLTIYSFGSLLFILIAAFFFPRVINSENDLIGISSHFAMTSLPGWELATNGVIPITDYGFGITLLTALALKVSVFFGFKNVTLYQVGLIYQVLFYILIFINIRILSKKLKFLGFAIFIALTYYLYPQFTPYFYPNHSGMRYLFALITLCEFSRVITRNKNSMLSVWVLSGFAVIANPETAIPIISGIIFFAILNRKSTWKSKKGLVSICAGTVIYVTAVSIAFSVVNYFTTGKVNWNLFSFLNIVVGKGYGGLTSTPDILIIPLIGMNLLAIYKIRKQIYTVSKDRKIRDNFGASLAVISIVWFPYYFNRMDSWNLGFYVLLLVLMLVNRSSTDKSVLHELVSYKSNIASLSFCLILLFAIVVGLGNSTIQIKQMIKGNAYCEKSILQLSGLCLNNKSAGSATESMQSLTDIHEPTSSLVLSLLPTEIRLLGYNENFPWNDPYSEIFTVRDELMLRNWIDYSGPRRILVEKISDDSIANRKPRTRFYERIMSSQDRYSEKNENKFFRVYERNDHINLVSDF